jgi:hypothetical protein
MVRSEQSSPTAHTTESIRKGLHLWKTSNAISSRPGSSLARQRHRHRPHHPRALPAHRRVRRPGRARLRGRPRPARGEWRHATPSTTRPTGRAGSAGEQELRLRFVARARTASHHALGHARHHRRNLRRDLHRQLRGHRHALLQGLAGSGRGADGGVEADPKIEIQVSLADKSIVALARPTPSRCPMACASSS